MACRTRRSISHSSGLFAGLATVLLLTACGKSLATRVTEAMDGCIAQRNPVFVAGRGVTALDAPLADSLSKAAARIGYQRALVNYELIAEGAGDQVTLVCALELASYFKHGDVAVLLWKYTKHPDAAVAESARKLLKTQDPLPGTFQ